MDWLILVAHAASAGIVMPSRTARARWRRLFDDADPRPGAMLGHVATVRAAVMPAGGPVTPIVAIVAGVLGLVLAGPVASGLLAVYGAVGSTLARRAATRRTEARCRGAAVDAVSTLAAELRAGLPVGVATAEAARSLTGPTVVGDGARTVARRVASAIAVAEVSGAPLADVLDRLDAHLRAVDRARATAAAQAAGARASALLLAAMPIAGLGLGYLIGVDSMHVLLHTPLGSACLVGSVFLQLGGLAWTARLSRVEVAA